MLTLRFICFFLLCLSLGDRYFRVAATEWREILHGAVVELSWSGCVFSLFSGDIFRRPKCETIKKGETSEFGRKYLENSKSSGVTRIFDPGGARLASRNQAEIT